MQQRMWCRLVQEHVVCCVCRGVHASIVYAAPSGCHRMPAHACVILEYLFHCQGFRVHTACAVC